MDCVDLVKRFPTSVYSLTFVLIQPRTASKCVRQDRGGRQARRQNTPRRTGQRLASFAKRANKTRQRANTAMLVGWLVSRARRNRARGTQTKKKNTFPPYPLPRSFLSVLSFFPYPFLFLFSPLFFLLGKKTSTRSRQWSLTTRSQGSACCRD